MRDNFGHPLKVGDFIVYARQGPQKFVFKRGQIHSIENGRVIVRWYGEVEPSKRHIKSKNLAWVSY